MITKQDFTKKDEFEENYEDLDKIRRSLNNIKKSSYSEF